MSDFETLPTTSTPLLWGQGYIDELECDIRKRFSVFRPFRRRAHQACLKLIEYHEARIKLVHIHRPHISIPAGGRWM